MSHTPELLKALKQLYGAVIDAVASGAVRPVGGSLLDAIRDARGAITEAEGRK
jgi:hypothetical protein